MSQLTTRVNAACEALCLGAIYCVVLFSEANPFAEHFSFAGDVVVRLLEYQAVAALGYQVFWVVHRRIRIKTASQRARKIAFLRHVIQPMLTAQQFSEAKAYVSGWLHEGNDDCADEIQTLLLEILLLEKRENGPTAEEIQRRWTEQNYS
mmetsp:Transcript_3028/g.4658  ORF Transcript_3028/g.4658 Transcript_3028/m.4658 type:complete len:150 (+) Transcript_3028:128-577(+)